MKLERLIVCGGLPEKKRQASSLRLQLDPRSLNCNIKLKLSDISNKLVKDIPDLLVDLIELATYVYCGDQSFSRGGDAGSGQGTRWRRTMHFVVPVRCLDIWRSSNVSSALHDALGFLSDEEITFEFRHLRDPIPVTGYFEFGPDESMGAEVDEVLLFSGGLDSLAGVMREAVVGGRRVALVSHRSTPKVVRYRGELVNEIAKLCPGHPPYHIPVWSHKSGLKSRENTQRVRTFLYASLATVVARLYDLQRIRFYENGITSMNLPISAQLIGSRASRSTHPRALHLFARLFSALTGSDFAVENPGFWSTKTELVNEIADGGGANLIARTRSCHHTQDATRLHTHCGRCSQCVGRRLSVTASKGSKHDPVEMYKSDPLISATKEGPERTLAEGYPRFASEIESLTLEEFIERSGEVRPILNALGGSVDDNVRKIFRLHRRHAHEVSSALETAIKTFARQIRRRQIESTSLLGMVAGARPKETRLESTELATQPEYFYPSSDYLTARYKDTDIPIRPTAAQMIQAMHEELVMTKVPTVSVSVIAETTGLKGDLVGNLRKCEGIWDIIVGPGGKGKVKFLVLPAPESNRLVFRSEP